MENKEGSAAKNENNQKCDSEQDEHVVDGRKNTLVVQNEDVKIRKNHNV